MKSLALFTVVLALGYAGYRTFLSETPKPAPLAAADATAPDTPSPSPVVEAPKNTYLCSYTPSGQSETTAKDVYGVNVPTQAAPSLETNLSGIAKVTLNLGEANFIVAQISTADEEAPGRLLAEGQFSMKDGLDLAAIRDGVKVGTLTCGYVPETAAVTPATN